MADAPVLGGDTVVEGSLTVQGDFIVHGNLVIEGSLTVSGATTLGTLQVNGEASFARRVVSADVMVAKDFIKTGP